MDLKDLKHIHVNHAGDDDHNDKQIVEFLEKFLGEFIKLREEVDRLAQNQEKILDYLDSKVNESL